MIVCPSCGTSNAEGARFCNGCGSSLIARVATHERRVVTALFADLARSTGIGERLDPEVVRGLVGQFFELATREIEARGGTVEKFSGDAVMAVFGLPQAHEDDPERAVRAALAIRDGLAAMAGAAQERHGITLQARIGMEAGEVVIGDPFAGATMATGDAMNLAARLEQQAEPGDVVVGEQVWDAVRDLVTGELLGELELRGHESAVRGWRVQSVSPEIGRPRGVPGLQAPLTGRTEELQMLLDAGRRSQTGNKAALFTVLGVPGVGKSRLIREATIRLATEGWTTVRGRCLPYGDGITYWPVAEMVRDLASITAADTSETSRSKLESISPEPDVASRLAQITGLATAEESPAQGADREISWAVRRVVENVTATRGPLVLVFEDIHWAEPPLLDLIEYVVTWTRDAPLLAICSSRPELLDARPNWGSGRMEASRIHLEPLTEAASRELLGSLLAVDDLPGDIRQRVLDRAEGNPLFVEEVVRMLIEEGVVERRGDRWVAKPGAADIRVPENVEALIRARLDTLPSQERATVQAASVVGRIFQQSAVAAIAPSTERATLQQHLEDAILRDLITDERVHDEPTFRFRHILIRDVAYATLPKARRADLHRGVADWLRAWAGERIQEFADIEAYHLEQNVLLRHELEGAFDPVERDRAVAALRSAAERAAARDDARAARTFSERALALQPSGHTLLEIRALLADALWRSSEYRAAGEVAVVLEAEAEAAGRKDLQGRAILLKANDIWLRLESADSEVAMREVERARALLLESGDWRSLVLAIEMMGWAGWWQGDLERSRLAFIEMRDLAHQLGWATREAEAVMRLVAIAAHRGEVEERQALVDTARAIAASAGSRLTKARVDRTYGITLCVMGQMDEGTRVLKEAGAILEELGDREEAYTAYQWLGNMSQLLGRPAEALAYYEHAEALVLEHAGFLPEALRHKAQVLVQMGDIDTAAEHAERAVAIAGRDDWATVASTRMALGRVREAQGRLEEAEALLREAADVKARVDFSSWEEELALGEFLLHRGRRDEAIEWLARARASAARFGPASPLVADIEARVAAAAAS